MVAVQNTSALDAVVRIKDAGCGAVFEELSLAPGETAECRLPCGRFVEVVRYGARTGPFDFRRGAGFSISTLGSAREDAPDETIVLAGNPDPNRLPCTAAEFD